MEPHKTAMEMLIELQKIYLENIYPVVEPYKAAMEML